MFAKQARRSFMSALASFAGLAAIDASGQAAAQVPVRPGDWDLAWLDRFAGKHKQVFDYGSFEVANDARALRFVRNYLDTHRDVFGLSSPDIDTAVGVTRAAFPMNASDALWQKYRLGERWKIVDPVTRQPSTRNIFLEDGAGVVGVKALQSRGTVFWQCNVALNAIVQELAQDTRMAPQDVRNEVLAGLNTGVRLVPSHVMAVGLVQERGFTYLKP
jgi:hypothetical protein